LNTCRASNIICAEGRNHLSDHQSIFGKKYLVSKASVEPCRSSGGVPGSATFVK
jgi:hypothetical protein